MVLRKEFRIVLPMTVEEYKVGHLYTVSQASKLETGGGEGVEIVHNEPYEEDGNKGQYTHKIHYIKSKVPNIIRKLAPTASLEIHEKSWNTYPYCKTEISNPDYMKENFYIVIQTWHKPGRGEIDNVHNLSEAELSERAVIPIDIANDPVSPMDYNPEWDPTTFKSVKTQRGPLSGPWKSECEPVMCVYKLVTCEFKWYNLQPTVENIIQKSARRVFHQLNRQAFCWIDNYIDLNMDDIRRIEDTTKDELNELRSTGVVRGMSVN